MFTVNRQVLEAELALLQSVAERKTTIPVLSMVLFDVSKGKANLTATDLDVTIKTSVGVSECDDWAFCVPAKQLYSLVRLFNGETIAFGVEGGRVKIQCENSKHFLPMMGKADYPDPDMAKGESVKIPAQTLSLMIKAVTLAASREAQEHDVRKTSVYLGAADGKLDVVACDAKEMAFTSIAFEKGIKFVALISLKSTRILHGFLEAEGDAGIVITENLASFTVGKRQITTRLMAEPFWDYKKLIPTDKAHKFTLPDSFSGAISRSMVVLSSQRWDKRLVWEINKTLLTIKSQDAESGESIETVAIDCPSLNGDDLELGINGAQIVDLLGTVKSELAIEIWSAEKAFRFTPTDNPLDFQYFTMPMRV